jgi:hypothetical protein
MRDLMRWAKGGRRLPELAAFLRLPAWGRQFQPQLALAGVQPQPLLQEPAQPKSLGQVRGEAHDVPHPARGAYARHYDNHRLAFVEATAGCVPAGRSHCL